MHSDIRNVIQLLNQRIENLERIKSMLLEEFGAAAVFAADLAPATSKQGRLTTGTGTNGTNGGGATRKQELIRFLLHNGPTKRGDIIAKSGIPKGTIAFLLNQPEFVRRDDGKWQVDAPRVAVTLNVAQHDDSAGRKVS